MLPFSGSIVCVQSVSATYVYMFVPGISNIRRRPFQYSPFAEMGMLSLKYLGSYVLCEFNEQAMFIETLVSEILFTKKAIIEVSLREIQ